MKKKNYMKPTLKVVKLQHSQQILTGSYSDIQTTSRDNDDPDYDGSSSGSIWDAN